MNGHLDNADLVALAILPDEAPDSRLHLVGCDGCSKRLAFARGQLDRLRREHDDSVERHDTTFWKAQELRIMREISRVRRPERSARGIVAAALVAVALGGFWLGRTSVDPVPSAGVASIASAVATSEQDAEDGLIPVNDASSDPWAADSISEFQAVVDWESWVDDRGKEEGTI